MTEGQARVYANFLPQTRWNCSTNGTASSFVAFVPEHLDQKCRRVLHLEGACGRYTTRAKPLPFASTLQHPDRKSSSSTAKRIATLATLT